MRHLLFFFILICFGCSYFKNSPANVSTLAWNPYFDSASLNNANLLAGKSVHTFYRNNGFKLIWSDSTSMVAAADSMISFIRSSEQCGLIPKDYHMTDIERWITTPSSPERSVRLDLILTDSYFSLREHLKNGRLARKDSMRRNISSLLDRDGITVLNRLSGFSQIRSEFERLQPKDTLYALLQSTLRNLVLEHKTDSASVKKRMQLAVNMERLRWETKTKPDRYIVVNIPSFVLNIIEDDTLVAATAVIVGRPETPTPELRSVINSFIIYPYWHVPRSILKEILPQIQEDTIYLRKHNYDVLDKSGKKIKSSSVDWKSFTDETFPYVLRQREGSENTMGVIKFVFENHYGIYLHDTNARRLFSKKDRALSHGCIRVKNAVALAHYLAKDDDVYVSPEDLDQYMLLQHRLEVKVAKPIPLFLEYFTCSEKNGTIIFHDDIYGKDKAMIQSLYLQLDPAM